MKEFKCFCVLVLLLFMSSCSSDSESIEDDSPNKSPLPFDLITVANEAENVDLLPTFDWEDSKDPDGEVVTYEFYLDVESNPSIKLGTDLTNSKFEIVTALENNTKYYWKVIARDGNGHFIQSVIYCFTTVAKQENVKPNSFSLIMPANSNTLPVELSPLFT